MASTPVNPQPTTEALSRSPIESKRWKTLLDALEPTRPIELTKQAGRVRLTRSLEQDENGKDAVIWTKTYQGTKTGQSGEIDLSVFNAWERTLILKAHDDGLNRCYRMAHLIEKGSGLHTDDTPDNVRQTRTTVIKTHHTGADLDIWRVMRPWSQGSLLEHPFVKQQHFLKLIRGVLFALHGFHSKRFVHCDLHPGNIVLPAEIKQLSSSSGEGDRYQLIARWDEIKLIDLGYSIHRGIEPPAMLPLALWELTTAGEYRRDAVGEKIPSKRMSPHLHNRLRALDAIASKWPASEVFSRKRWEQHQEKLRNLQELDWREDLYQLGYWLTKMRDGDEDGSWGDVRYVGDVVNVREVNAFICDFPQELMDWGLKRPLPDVMPHVGYIKGIDELIAALPASPDSFTLQRRDYDTAYLTYIDLLSKNSSQTPDRVTPQRASLIVEQQAIDSVRLLDQAAWDHACNLHSSIAYAEYLRKQPHGVWAIEAKIRQDRQMSEERSRHRIAFRLQLGGYAKNWKKYFLFVCVFPALVGASLLIVDLSNRHVWQNSVEPMFSQLKTSTEKALAWLNSGDIPGQRVAPEFAATDDTASLTGTAATRLTAYLAQTTKIERSDWWRKGRSLSLEANAEQIGWIKDTVTYAKQEQWPRAQFALAGLYCSGAYPSLVPFSPRDCGKWMAAALDNPQSSRSQQSVDERNKMISAVVSTFDDLVFGYAHGDFRDSPPDDGYAHALLPGLLALQAEHPGLALRAAHVQACSLQPVQKNSGIRTLQDLIQHHPNSQEAIQAAKWLERWRRDEFGCRSK